MEPRVILITGASSGIGRAAARTLARKGHIVYGAARRLGRIEALVADGVRPVELDITDEGACRAAVGRVLAEQGRVDVLVNNAGYGSYGAVEDVALAEARRQFEVNVFGAAALVKAVAPGMRERRSGTIINVSSMGGRLVVSRMGAWYHATKYALEALSDALRVELADFGIRVVLIEPGAIRTQWGAIAADHLEESSKGGAYEARAARTAAVMRRLYSSPVISAPHVVVRAMERAISASRPRTRYLIGFGAKPVVALQALLPARAFDWIVKRTS